MSLLNLTAGELIALMGTISAMLVTLYMLDRSRRKQVVATLRFWRHAETNTEMRQRRRIQQPWSLVLQLASMLLLLLAIAQLQWGNLTRAARDHVLILDTSAWMGANTPRGTLMEQAREAALAYVKAVPAADRILLVRADGLVTPATPVGSNRAAVEHAIRDSRPSASALNLAQAIEFAQRTQSGQGRKAGEIVYVGPGRVAGNEALPQVPANLRVLAVSGAVENCGIRKIGLRRPAGSSDLWDVFLVTRNYGATAQTGQLAVQFGGAPIGSRTVALKPGAEQETTFTFRTRAAGLIEARLLNQDAFQEDNRVVLEVPAQSGLKVVVYSNDSAELRPILETNPRISTEFRPTALYEQRPQADIVILDRFAPAQPPRLPAIWIEPPQKGSPVAVKGVVQKAKLARWNADHPIGAGLRTRDLILDSAEILAPSRGDTVIAESDRGPLIVAAGQGLPRIVLGFRPAGPAMKYELAAPLLFANLLRSVKPELFRQWELNGGTVGTVEADLGKRVDQAKVQLISNEDRVPYTIANGNLRFFAAKPGRVLVQTGDREIAYSLTLPEVGLAEWSVPETVRKGVPRFRGQDSPVFDLWPWLAAAGALGLLAEWLLFGRGRSGGRVAHVRARAGQRVLQRRAS